MKLLAIILNIVLCSILIYAIYNAKHLRNTEWFIVLLVFSTTISSIIALMFRGKENILFNGKEGLIRLYIKRRALEEKQRIKKLSDDKE